MKNKKYLYLIPLILIMLISYYSIHQFEKLLLDNVILLKEYYNESPRLFISIYSLSYILLTSISLPVALIMGILAGFIFELYLAIIIMSFSLSIGATVAMLISRYFIYDFVSKRYQKQIHVINNELAINGAYYLFALRMSLVFPFFIINLSFGLTNIKAKIFYLITQIGMLPGTVLIVLIGVELNRALFYNGILSVEPIIYLTILGLIPLLIKKHFQNK